MGVLHKILERELTPDNIKIQMEDWREVYPNSFQTLTIGCYPIAKQSGRHGWIEKGENFRCAIEIFKDNNEAYEIFEQLMNGEVKIEELGDRIRDPKHKYYLGLIEEEPWI